MFWTQQVEYRVLSTAAGYAFNVPEYILRVDDERLTGWQLRYGEWTDFEDYSADKAGIEKALLLAIDEMTARIAYRGK